MTTNVKGPQEEQPQTAPTSFSMLSVDTKSPVLVTGASGYVAGVLIQQLLEADVTVHATVRNVAKQERYQHLLDLAEKTATGSLKFFSADLVQQQHNNKQHDDGGFGKAMEGCSIVFHTASPFVLDVTDPQSQLVEPAVQGTRRVLEAVNRTPSVQRVVLTSSTAAIFTDAADTDPQHPVTEKDWNTTTSIDYQPYYVSKKLAEETAWRMYEQAQQEKQREEEDPNRNNENRNNHWKLVVINPGFVLGPGLKYHGSSESFGVITQLASGAGLPGLPNFGLHLVDVREVAQAHIRAAYLPEASGRHLVCATHSSMWELAQIIRSKHSHLPLPKWCMPVWIIWLLAPYFWVTPRLTRDYVAKNQNKTIYFDNTKSKQALGIHYRPLQETVNDMMEQILQADALSSYHIYAYLAFFLMGRHCIHLFQSGLKAMPVNFHVKKIKQV